MSFQGKSLLVFILILQGIGQGGELFFYPGPFGNFLLFELGVPQPVTDFVDRTFSLLLITLPFLFLWTKKKLFLGLMGALLFLISLAIFLRGSKRFYEIALLAHMARYLFPIALIFLFDSKREKSPIPIYIFKVGLSFTFIFHGIEALDGNPLFIDYVLDFFGSYKIEEKDAALLLKIVGVVDIIVGLLCVFFNYSFLFFYIAFWGLFTAALRPFYHGLSMGIFPMLLRSPHWGIPLFLAFKFLPQRPKEKSP
ncbi:hypothetical protein OAK75_07535 [Bacteriovoracales bacterium]|nr:hypothetical protein [Bacteriovoracales bacterium]